MSEKKFRFWLPIDKIEKSVDEKGNEVMIVGGIASTSRLDLDKQTLNPTREGFDVSYLKERGVINWNHSKQPDAVIGEPTKVEFTKAGMYVESMLYPDSELAQKVYKLGKSFQKHSKTRRLGYSIEGSALLKDLNNPSYVPKARITGLALTVNPKNADSYVDILKGEFHELKDDDVAQTEIVDIDKLLVKAESGDDDFALPAPIVDTVVAPSKRKLTKAECFEKIFERLGVITLEKANNIFETVNSLQMEVNKSGALTGVTEEMLEKALTTLGKNDLSKGAGCEGGEDKGKKPMKKKKKEEEEDDEDDETGNYEKMEKAITGVIAHQTENFGALGVLFKGLKTKVESVEELNKSLQAENKELKEGMEKLQKSVDEIGEQPQGRRSTATTKASERQFQKSLDGDNGGAGNGDNEEVIEKAITEGKAVRISNRRGVLHLLDQLAFEKGLNPEFAKALTVYESSGMIDGAIITKIQKERGITLIK